LKGYVGLLAAGLGGVALASAHAQPSQSAPQQTPVTIQGEPTIEFGEWPLEFADPDAVEAIMRYQTDWVTKRFGGRLEFVCLAYAYGQPTPEFFARFEDVAVPLKGRLNCSPHVGEPGFSVLIDLAEIRCSKETCTAISGLSFGKVIEPSEPVAARLIDGVWTVSSQRSPS